MSDPLRSERDAASPEAARIDRDARIEQLLLTGLDHYFAEDYDGAIDIWTRVSFLERGHSRAKAYIDRARGALAERQRESEELLHRGIDAFNHGDTAAARTLINEAIDQIGPNDVALALLDRMNRLSAAPRAQTARVREPLPVALGQRLGAARPARRVPRGWLLLCLGLLACGAVAAAGLGLEAWAARTPAAADRVAPAAHEPLPIVRPADLSLERARTLYAGGHVRDALAALDDVGPANPLRAEAESLRGEMQQRLLDGPGRPATAPSPQAGTR